MAEMISKQHLLEQIDTTGKGCKYEGKEFLAYQEAMLAVVELIEKEPAVEKEYDVMFSGTEHMDSPGPAPAVGYRIAAKRWEEAVQKGKFYAEMQHPAFIPFAFAGPVIEVPKEELENLETQNMKKECSTCVWHDGYTWVCFNGNSEYRADFTDPENTCPAWEERKEQNEKT